MSPCQDSDNNCYALIEIWMFSSLSLPSASRPYCPAKPQGKKGCSTKATTSLKRECLLPISFKNNHLCHLVEMYRHSCSGSFCRKQIHDSLLYLVRPSKSFLNHFGKCCSSHTCHKHPIFVMTVQIVLSHIGAKIVLSYLLYHLRMYLQFILICI